MASRQDFIKRDLSILIYMLISQFNCIKCIEGNPGFTSKISSERMKFELEQLMNIQNARTAEEPKPSVESIYNSIVSDIEMEKLVMLDIFVRDLATLKPGDSCNPIKQGILDRAPLTLKFGDPNPTEIIDWQRELLLNREPMCNYMKHLRCQADTQTCCCKEGLVLRNGVCVLELGVNCGTDYYFQSFYFDALKNVKYLVPDPSPRCQATTSCQRRPLFFRKKCWCDGTEGCNEDSIFTEIDYSTLKTQFDAKFSLGFGDECDPEFHREMFDPAEYELTDAKARVEKLKAILDFPLLKLCNISKHLNCSEDTRRCSCWDSLEYEVKTQACHGIRGAPCGENSLQMEFSPSGPRIWHLERVFAKNLKTRCINGAKCMESRKCACTKNFGDFCRFPGSTFTQILHEPIKFSSNICEDEIYNVFDQTNKNMLKLEKEMVLSKGEACRVELEEDEIDKIMKFWKDLEIRWNGRIPNHAGVECKDILLALNEISERAKALTEAGWYFCDRKKGLCCGGHSKKCVCLKGTTWQDGRCRLLAGQLCDRWNELVPRNTPCVREAECEALEDGRHVCRCLSGDPGPLCRQVQIPTPETTLKPAVSVTPAASTDTSVTTEKPSVLTDMPVTAVVDHTSTSIPSQNSSAGNHTIDPKPTEQEKDLLNELMDILVELSLDRVVPIDKPCHWDPSEQFLNIAKEYSKSNKEKIPMKNVSTLVIPLRMMYEQGYHFCNVRKWLICSEFLEECVCEPTLNTTSQGQEKCVVGPGERCNITTKVYDLKEMYILPDPPCFSGYVCMLPPVNDTNIIVGNNSTKNNSTEHKNFTICVPNPHKDNLGVSAAQDLCPCPRNVALFFLVSVLIIEITMIE